MTRWLLLAAGAALLFSACAPTALTPPAPSAPAPGALSAAPSSRRQTVAVLPFANDGVGGHERLDFLREWLPDVIGASLRSAEELRVVERRELLKILQEQKLGASALASKEGRLQLGKIAGAQTLVFGSFAAIGDTLQLSARIVDVESGVVLKSAAVHGDISTARSLGNDLSRRLANDLGLSVARAVEAAGVTDNRALAQAELFYQGLAAERSGETERAIDSYRRALEIDPKDGQAREHLKKLLGASH